MAKKPPVRVALDLETTGLHADQDAILEVAAIKFQGSIVLDRMETLIAPGRSIPYRVQRLTGITPQKLIGAPPFEAVSRKLQTFLGDFPIVGHSIPFDVGFLRRRGLVRTNPLIDTFELATVLLPSLPSYNLGQVAHSLGVTVAPGRHRAMVDTILAMDVFLALHEMLDSVDISLLKDLASLDAPRSWPLLGFFKQELRDRQERDGLRGMPLRGSLGERFAAQLGMDPRVLSFAIANEDPPAIPSAPVTGQPIPFVLDRIDQAMTLIETSSARNEPLASRDYKEACTSVKQALTKRTPLMMEVTVGGNDYTPVILPALEWLNEEPASESPLPSTPRRLVIACANQQNVRRLLDQALPQLQRALHTNLPMAHLAERDGYLCVHRWFGAALRRTNGELTAEQARGLAKLGLWAQQTRTGERHELTMLPHEMSAWERISSGYERIPTADGRSCAYDRCTYRRKGYCFVSRAEERVNNACIIVTTHAGLLDDLTRSQSLLTATDRQLILDADLLEDEIARWSGQELDHTHLMNMLNTIGVELPDGRYQGLLALAAPVVRQKGPGGLSMTPTISKAELDPRMLGWFQMLRQAHTAVDHFFNMLSHLLEEFHHQGSGGGRDKGRSDSGNRSHNGRSNERIDQSLRLTNQIHNLENWGDVERAWQQAEQRLQMVVDLLREVEKIILSTRKGRSHLDVGNCEDDSLASEFTALAQRLLDQKQLGRQALKLGDSDMAYWLRMPPPAANFAQNRQADSNNIAADNAPILYAQLAQSATFLKRTLLQNGQGPIFAGVALSVDGDFSFARNRFGLEPEVCPVLSIVTEYQKQTLLYLPDDVPEPNMPQYQRHLDMAITQLAQPLEGRLVVLYTSHAALRSSYSTIKPLLEAQGILVLGHGIDGSPRQLWQLFQEQERIVLLGTGSFWDGIEEITRVPTCVMVARLPMPVLNDPLIAARAEQMSDQLHQLTVPIAAQRMRRALNRIAWSGPKRNAVILFDRRVISKEYGSIILHTLPRSSSRQGGISHMPETILDWLTSTDAWE